MWAVARWLRRRWLPLVVLAIAALHGLLYVVLLPAWDLYDEEQHLAYALALRDERRIPHLDDTIPPEIVRSAVATDRWMAYRIDRPPDTSAPEALGMEGRSYEAYQPPLYYAIVALLLLPAGDDALSALYLARASGVLALVTFVALSWALARQVAPDSRAVPASAALAVAGIPAVAQAGARVSNDLFAAALLLATVVATVRLLDTPTTGRAALAGTLAAAAVLTKSHGLAALAVCALGVAILWRRGRRGRRDWRLAALAVMPALIAAASWARWSWSRYGVLEGSTAYLDRYGTWQPLPMAKFVEAFWLTAWSDYWGAYRDAGALLVVTNLALLGTLGVGLAGLRRAGSRALPLPLALSAALAIVLLAALGWANHTAIVRPAGRLLLALYPPLAVAAALGWRRPGREWLALVVPAVIWCASLAYLTGWFLPRF